MAEQDNAPAIISWKAAKLAGLKRYYTGIPCKRGHLTERQTSSGQCMRCAADICTRQYYANREQRLAQGKEYRLLNPEKKKEQNRAYCAANKEKQIAKAKAWYWANYERARQARKAYTEKHLAEKKAQDKAYAKANRKQVALVKRRYRARRRNATGDHTLVQIEAMAKQQGHKCANCRKSIKRGYHADHIVPLIRSGSNDISNIQLLCGSCNCAKGGKDPFIWAQELGRLL